MGVTLVLTTYIHRDDPPSTRKIPSFEASGLCRPLMAKKHDKEGTKTSSSPGDLLSPTQGIITFPKTNSSPLKLGHPKRKGSFFLMGLPSLKLTAQPLKIDGWKMNFPFGARPIFRGELLVLGSVTYPHPRYIWVNDFLFPQVVGYGLVPWRVKSHSAPEKKTTAPTRIY